MTRRFEDAEFFKQRHKDQQALVKERLELGYRRRGFKELSGHQVGPVHEEGLRSETLKSEAAKMFVASVPRAHDLRSNWGKGTLEKLRQKIFSLDEPYVEGNRRFLGFLRIDTDRVWNSVEECRSFYRLLAHDGKVACEPHFLVGLKLKDGRFVRPHAIWMLPKGAAIWNEPGKEGWKRGPVDLFHSVYFGLNNALLEAGADAGAPATSQQVKCPLSPEWHTICPQDSHFPDLAEHAEYLELNHNRETLLRKAASVQSGLDIVESNQIFNVCQKMAYTVLNEWHFSADTDFVSDRKNGRLGAIVDRLHVKLEELLSATNSHPSECKKWCIDKKHKNRSAHPDNNNVHLIIAKVAEYAVAHWNPDVLQRSRKNRGAAMHEVEGLKSLKERQSVGGRYSVRKNAERVQNAIVIAIKRLTKNGETITKAAVARESGVSRPTINKYWPELSINCDNHKKVQTDVSVNRFAAIMNVKNSVLIKSIQAPGVASHRPHNDEGRHAMALQTSISGPSPTLAQPARGYDDVSNGLSTGNTTSHASMLLTSSSDTVSESLDNNDGSPACTSPISENGQKASKEREIVVERVCMPEIENHARNGIACAFTSCSENGTVVPISSADFAPYLMPAATAPVPGKLPYDEFDDLIPY
ncbi:hypothetical protein DK867_04465 [Ochrobactrum sp. POC9]|nr:hypothetical protein DK867_04465 [Ochrobactrum sp. POC9]